MSEWIVWLLITIVLCLMEFININLTSICFALSALFALIISLFTKNFLLQFLIFIVFGLIFIVTIGPLVKRSLKKIHKKNKLDKIINKKGTVTKSILKDELGQVKIKGKFYSAYSDKPIVKGKDIKVLKIDGVKLKVEEIS